MSFTLLRTAMSGRHDGRGHGEEGMYGRAEILHSNEVLSNWTARVGHRVVTGALGRGIRTVIDVPGILHGYRTRWNVESITE
jgi:hypothetical protein